MGEISLVQEVGQILAKITLSPTCKFLFLSLLYFLLYTVTL